MKSGAAELGIENVGGIFLVLLGKKKHSYFKRVKKSTADATHAEGVTGPARRRLESGYLGVAVVEHNDYRYDELNLKI